VDVVHKIFPDDEHKNEESKAAAGEVKHEKDPNAAKADDVILTKIIQAKERAERNMQVKDVEQPSEIAEIAKEIQDEGKDEDNDLHTDLSVGSAAHAWAKNASLFGTTFTIFLFPASQGVRIFMDFWVKYWQNDVLGRGAGSDMWYIGIYALIFLVFVLFLLWRGLFWYFFSFRASTNLHSRFFKTIVHAPMLFFTKEPLGRILKSYSKDQDQVDDSLPDVSHLALIYWAISIATIAAMCVVLPIYAVIGFLLIVVWYVVQRWLATPVTSCKNAVARTDAQVVVHAAESLHGIAVVRAFGVQEIMEKEHEIVMDTFGSSVFHLDHISLWTATLFDVVAALFVVLSAIICILYKDSLAAADVGVIMTNSTQLLVFLGLMVNALNDSAYQLFSVGRLQHYIQSTPQEIFTKTVDIPKNDKGRPNFPSGSIEFNEVEMKYDPMRDFVLRKLTCAIKDKERIGIVGRTGAGKSTLINAIFRLTELHSGDVKVSGYNIRDLDIKDLRRSLSIIPQEPVVFRGSVRSNVDPFGEFSEEELHEALKASNMYDAIMELPSGLDTEIAEGGGNLSLGQRQLLCLTRVCLRKERRILILDEATSALDPVTDQTIQKTLREVFNQHSILTIAHRLDTIIDYDKILVLNHGKLLEFDTVPNLLKKEGGAFRQMYEGATH
jgi:ABC-type multidrug transport system fused ATPase/permease subunit